MRRIALSPGLKKIVPPGPPVSSAPWRPCPVDGREFLAVDEISCARTRARPVFTHRLLHARGRYETMFWRRNHGPFDRRLLPGRRDHHPRAVSRISPTPARRAHAPARRTAVVAFSANEVYAIAELIRRQRAGRRGDGLALPRAQRPGGALYQSGEVDFLVATDAIGMGLNMDVDHVAFAGLKFDGKRQRFLHPQEVGQIAGRAGCHTDGTFGVTGECDEMDDDLSKPWSTTASSR